MQKNYIHYLFILVVCWFAFFVNNGSVYEDIMESRNLVTAHEMIEYDNWLVPTMNGELRLENRLFRHGLPRESSIYNRIIYLCSVLLRELWPR
ncbi:MAG: hypothetical protein ACLTZT_10120 [Butyricimonas faecalis]